MRWLLVGAGVLLFVVFCACWFAIATPETVGVATLVGIVVGLISGFLIMSGLMADR